MEALSLFDRNVRSLTRGEREFACEYLTFTKNLLKDSVEGLTRAAMDARVEPHRWNIAECIEHLALSGDITWKILHERISQAPTPENRELARMTIKKIICIMSDRSKKSPSPSGVMPARLFVDGEVALEHFMRQRNRLIDFVRRTDAHLKNRHAFYPAIGAVDLYQFLLVEGAHTARHILQIEEVKAEFGLSVS